MSVKSHIETKYGLRALLPGRIHVVCPTCGRRYGNAQRAPWDPSEAALIETECPKCIQGYPILTYYDASGREIELTTGRD